MKTSLILILLTLSSLASNQIDQHLNLFGRFVTDEITKGTDGYISVYDNKEGVSIIGLPEYSSFDILRLQIGNFINRDPNLIIIRPWQKNVLNDFSLILQEKLHNKLCLISFMTDEHIIMVIWGKEQLIESIKTIYK